MPIGEIFSRDVVLAEKKNTAFEAAQRMRHHHVGDLIVVETRDGQRMPVGIVTDRDIVVDVIANDRNVRGVTVEDIMSRELVTAHERDGVFDTIRLMRGSAVRRLPIVNDQNLLVGVVSIDDLLELLALEMTELSRVMPRERAAEAHARP